MILASYNVGSIPIAFQHADRTSYAGYNGCRGALPTGEVIALHVEVTQVYTLTQSILLNYSQVLPV